MATDLVVRRAGKNILDRTSLTLESKQLMALIAPSGTGKSTLLRCLAGLDGFDEGRVTASGELLRKGGDQHPDALVRRRVGFVFQELHLFGHMTALANVAEAPVSVLKESEKQARSRAEVLLESLGVGHRASAFPDEMSGGERQRVAIARALAMKPSVLLLDEPTSALDHERRLDLVKVLRALAEDGTAVLMATHDADLARAHCDAVSRLEGGVVVADG